MRNGLAPWAVIAVLAIASQLVETGPADQTSAVGSPEFAVPDSDASGVYYSRCAEARAAGAAPIYAGEPGYREGLDGDGDGVACEPYYGR